MDHIITIGITDLTEVLTHTEVTELPQHLEEAILLDEEVLQFQEGHLMLIQETIEILLLAVVPEVLDL